MRSWKSWCDITSKAERVLAVDVGTARWGLAVSDALGLLAHPAGTIPAAPDAVDRLVAKAVELSVGRVLMGWPRRTDGGEGTMAEEVRRLAAVVHERSGLPVAIWDERLTTREAEKILIARGRRRRDRRQVIDELSAVLILQSYLDRNQEARPGMQGKDGGHMTQEHDHSLEDEIITLTDEDGEEHQFAILDVIEVDNKEYAILIPTDEAEESGEDEAVILRLETDETGEEVLVDIEDDEEWQKVAQAWEELVEDEEDEEDEGEEDDDED